VKILFVGVFAPESTNTPMASALESLGQNVVRLPYREIAAHGGSQGLAKALQEKAEKADVVLVAKGLGGDLPGFDAATLKSLPCKSIYWLPDSTDVQGFPVIDLARACDIACATSLVSCTAIERWGHKAVNQIFEGYDPKVFRPRRAKKEFDVTFVGSLDPHRVELLVALDCAGIKVHRPTAYMRDLSKVYNRSRVVLNICRGQIFSDRVIQGMASGAYMLSEYCEDLDAAFEVGAEVGVFWTWSQLVHEVQTALRDEKWREGVAATGAEAVKKYTWKNQVAKILRAINGEEIADGAFSRC